MHRGVIMNTAITSVRISPSSLGSVVHRVALATTAWISPRREPLSREELTELVEMRRMAERLLEERARDAARMGRMLA
jgi:hypothetical protein